MASDNISRLSLVAQYDELCRCNKVLITGCESEFKHFVEAFSTQKQLKLKQAEAKISELQKTINTLEMEKKGFEGQIKQLKSLIGEEVTKGKKVESENNILREKIACIQGILGHGNNIDGKTKEQVKLLLSDAACAQRQPFARSGTVDDSIESLLSPSEYDDTFELTSLNVSSYQQKRPSTGNTRGFGNQSYGKRTKLEKTATSQVEMDQGPDLLKIDKVPEVERCLDVQSSSELNSSVGALSSSHELDYEPVESCRYNLRNRRNRRTVSNPSYFQSPSSTGGIFSQGHSFVPKSANLYEKCYPCEKIIALCRRALKCNNCKMMCHPECKDQCPATCIRLTPCSTKGSEWIPSHVNIQGNKIADALAKAGADDVSVPSAPLTYLVLFSRAKSRNKTIWLIPPVHHWYQGTRPVGCLSLDCNRFDQTTLTRLLSGHIRSLTFFDNSKCFEICPK
ncbi:hypothetical protein AVEN_137705-1 [Araneus ventricosus]|uniref:Phorbol-ester/DAG-type domain-containing protein n=1 Tax=Araneus ventricosus TaxID=182803 RepID=A0A4Y2PMQ8_ARAVE|nr:hypothetical protein AVEN_137705-1 [Araneus ventricosus]